MATEVEHVLAVFILLLTIDGTYGSVTKPFTFPEYQYKESSKNVSEKEYLSMINIYVWIVLFGWLSLIVKRRMGLKMIYHGIWRIVIQVHASSMTMVLIRVIKSHEIDQH